MSNVYLVQKLTGVNRRHHWVSLMVALLCSNLLAAPAITNDAGKASPDRSHKKAAKETEKRKRQADAATQEHQQARRKAEEAYRKAKEERRKSEDARRQAEEERRRILSEQKQAKAQLDTTKTDLSDLHGKLKSLKENISKDERQHASTADLLAETEQSISTTRRQLYSLAQEKAMLEGEIRRLQNEGMQLNQRIQRNQQQVSEILRRQYVSGGQEGTRHLLGSRDFNQLARDSHYLSRLGKAQTDQLEELRRDLAERERLLEEARVAKESLARLAGEQGSAHARLVEEQKKHQETLGRLSDRLRKERQQADTLRGDENRLSKLIGGLGQILAKPLPKLPDLKPEPKLELPPAPVAKTQSNRTQDAPVAAKETAKSDVKTASASSVPSSAVPQRSNAKPASEPVVTEAKQDAAHNPTGLAFAQLRGKMHLPVRGELLGRFGAPRADGGTTWKGVFIRTSSGSEVRSVAGGRVAFADWLRGFGNLVIVDHGEGYLTIYGNNESVIKSAGDSVRTGEVIARAGNSGGNLDTGVYFEIRQHGQPQDPLKWAVR